jgi:hypothetical protein
MSLSAAAASTATASSPTEASPRNTAAGEAPAAAAEERERGAAGTRGWPLRANTDGRDDFCAFRHVSLEQLGGLPVADPKPQPQRRELAVDVEPHTPDRLDRWQWPEERVNGCG